MSERNSTAIKLIDGWVVYCNVPVVDLGKKVDWILKNGEIMMTVQDSDNSPVSINVNNIVRIYTMSPREEYR